MHIDSYHFGTIVIDGIEYTRDCMLIGGNVYPDWWRKSGHLLNIEDLNVIIKANPSNLIIGTGSAGAMKVPESVLDKLEQHQIQTEVFMTSEAVERFNKLSKTQDDVAAAFHLTC